MKFFSLILILSLCLYSFSKGDNDKIVAKIVKIISATTQTEKIQSVYDLIDCNKYKKVINGIPDINPLHPQKMKRISSYYGVRKHPISKKLKQHHGLDLVANQGAKIYAPARGKVILVSRKNTGYGNEIKIQHPFGFVTRFAHLHHIKVRNGQKVTKGQVIGTVGTTGYSTGPHLHYEIFKNGHRIDPLKMIQLEY
ncbi:MAG: M23 family metallopeptidase [Flavobacteriales bacterium]